MKEGEEYEYFDHMDWVDVNTEGISHFGWGPEYIPRDSIRYDVFHLRCACTRRLMAYLRKFMSKQSTDIMKEFSDLLLQFWSDYNVLVWNLNKPFTSFIGSELLQFIRSIKK